MICFKGKLDTDTSILSACSLKRSKVKLIATNHVEALTEN